MVSFSLSQDLLHQKPIETDLAATENAGVAAAAAAAPVVVADATNARVKVRTRASVRSACAGLGGGGDAGARVFRGVRQKVSSNFFLDKGTGVFNIEAVNILDKRPDHALKQ